MLAEELLVDMPRRLSHVRGVAEAAGRLGSDPVIVAAWLHDIGYAPHVDRTGMHALDGALHLDLLGAPKEVVSLVAFHTGSEFEAEERGLTDQLNQFNYPRRHELDLLILADMTTSPDGDFVTVESRLQEVFDRYGPQHPVHRAISRSGHYLKECCRRASEATNYPM